MTGRVIARLDARTRRRVLDELSRSTGEPVLVEFSTLRELDNATTLVGTLEGTAYSPGTPDVLLVRPVASSGRMYAISAAQVLRVSAVVSHGTTDPDADGHDTFELAYRLGPVLAGPAR